MLKIKDNFDLEKLKDYGFEKSKHKKFSGIDENGNDIKEEYNYYSKKIKYDYCNKCEVEASIGVTNDDRRIDKFGMVTCKFEYELYREFINNTLYYLIKDGIVEKVGEEDE